MIFRNAVTGVLHWDFVSRKNLVSFTLSLKFTPCQSSLGRFISFPVIDDQYGFRSIFLFVWCSLQYQSYRIN